MSGVLTKTLIAACLGGSLLAVAVNAAPHTLPLDDPPNPPQDCDDLSAVPMQFNIPYEDVQNVWLQGGCTGCHNVTEMGGLRLDVVTTSILQLVGQPSYRDNTILRVIPLNADYSLMYQLLSCTPPATYVAMPPAMGGGHIAPAMRALVYDWIAEGARGFDEDGNPVSDVLFISRFESQRFQRGVTP